MKIRKYWIRKSNENDTKPTEFETHIVFNEEELLDAQANIAEYMAEDYLEENDDDADDEPVKH